MSPMNWKRQLFLAIALFALGTFAYWFEYKKKPETDAAAEQIKKVFQLKDTSIEQLRVTNAGKTVELKCVDFAQKHCKPGDTSKWELVSPIQARADDANANGFVSSLSNLDATDTISLAEETPEKRAALLKEYGLDPASLSAPDVKRVEVKSTTGHVAVYLGQTHAIGDGVFAALERIEDGQKASGKLDDSRVFVLPNYFKTNLDKDLTYWRDKKLVSIASHEIDAFELKGSKSQLSGLRKSGVWTVKVLAGPDKDTEIAGDSENIEAMLNGAAFLMAKDFASEKKDDARAKAVLRSARPLVALAMSKAPSADPKAPAPEPITLTLYQKNEAAKEAGAARMVNPRIFATVSNLAPLFELEPLAKDRLDKGFNDLRQAKLLTSQERYQVKKFDFSGTPVGGMRNFAMSENQWSASNDKSPLDQEKFQLLLDRLAGSKIKNFLPAKLIPKGEEEGLRVTLGGDDKTPLKRQLVFWKEGSFLFARDLGSPRKDREAYQLDAEMISALPWSADFFKKAPAPEPSPVKK